MFKAVRKVPWRALSVSAVVAALTGCGASSRPDTVPVPALSSSPDAQRTIRSLEARFLDLPPDRRATLEGELRTFLSRFATDDASRAAKVELAWILLTARRHGEARVLAGEVRAGPPGASRDAADVVEAGVRRRQGAVEGALSLLEPLRGKIVDPAWRGLHQRELVEAYVAARRFTDAMGAMLDWAEQAAPLEREAVVAAIQALLDGMPAPALEAGLRSLSRAAPDDASGARAVAGRWLVEEARGRLVRSALSERDPDLARWLVESTPPRLGHDDTREALEALAATRAVAPRVAGRAIGVVLDVTDETSRRRSADLVSGVSHALGLPASVAREDAVRLVTRDASEVAEVDRALSELAGDGAVILVAGVTEESALAASLFAARSKIPVILLRRPSGASTPYSFMLGEEPSAEEAAIAVALKQIGARSIARVGLGGATCDTSVRGAGSTRFPVREWKAAHADALVVAADALCASDAIAEASEGGLAASWVLGLEAAKARGPGRRVWIGAGRFPFESHALSPDEAAWMERWGDSPSWYEALGRDLAVLAAAALADFPLAREDDTAAVEALHERARMALAAARAPLWSTADRGFGGWNLMARELRPVVEGRARPVGP